MQFGFVSAILPELSLADVVKFAAAERFECVELMCWPVGKAERRYAGVTHVDVTEFTKNDVQRVQQIMRDAGVAISALGYYPNPLAPDPAEAETYIAHIRKIIVAAELLGVGRMNTFIGRDWTKSVDANWPRFMQVWPPLVKFAEDHGVRIGIENCPMYFTKDEWPGGKNLAICPAIWRRMFDAIPRDNFGLNYDPSHLVWQRMDYIKPLREFAGRIFHVHAKDVLVDGARLDDVGILATPLEYHSPRIPSRGQIDWARFIAELKVVGYDGPVCIEVEDRDFEATLQSRQEALRVSGAFLRPLFAKKEK